MDIDAEVKDKVAEVELDEHGLDVEPDENEGEEVSAADLEAEGGEEETAAEEPSKEEAAEEDEKAAELDARLQQAAERAKLTPENIAAMGDAAPEVLRRLADGFDAVSSDFAALGRKASGEPGPMEQGKAGAEHEEAPKGAEKKGEEDFTFPMDDADREAFGELTEEKILKPAASAINTLRGQLEEQRQAMRQLASVLALREADSFFATAAKDYGEMFGEGEINALDPNSDQAKARMGLLEEADMILSGAAAKGRQMSVREAMNRALAISTKGQAEERAREQLNSKVKKRSRQRIRRPTSRTIPDKKQTSDDAAMEAYEKKAAELGVSLSEG